MCGSFHSMHSSVCSAAVGYKQAASLPNVKRVESKGESFAFCLVYNESARARDDVVRELAQGPIIDPVES